MERPQSFYEDAWTDRQWNDMVLYSPVGRHINRWILKFISKIGAPLNTIADIGCGNGKLLHYISKYHPNAQFLGSDLSLNSVNQCKKLFPHGEFFQQNLNVLSNPFHKTVDLSICSEVIEHIENDHIALLNIARFSKFLIITVPAGPVDQMSKDMGHLRHYTRESLMEKLDQAGFETLICKVWGGPFSYPLYSMMRDKAGTDYVTGKYSLFKKILTHMLYYIFYLNDPFNFGNKVFALCKNKGF